MQPTGIGTRPDHTAGSFRITSSPFNTTDSLIACLNLDGSDWCIERNHVGGNGIVTQAIERKTRKAETLWKDVRGGWWIQQQIMSNVLIPDIDRTLGLYYAKITKPRTCPLCGDKIRPASDKMTGQWWNLQSDKQTWRCGGCHFVGTFADFCDEHDRQVLPESELVY